MDQQQREQFPGRASLIRIRMRQRSWTVARTAEAAGISTSTMYKVLRGEIVSPRTLGKVRKELNIVMAVKPRSTDELGDTGASGLSG